MTLVTPHQKHECPQHRQFLWGDHVCPILLCKVSQFTSLLYERFFQSHLLLSAVVICWPKVTPWKHRRLCLCISCHLGCLNYLCHSFIYPCHSLPLWKGRCLFPYMEESVYTKHYFTTLNCTLSAHQKM